nr:MAG TPA: hypothetical protein [Caudoviricetes sp.]
MTNAVPQLEPLSISISIFKKIGRFHSHFENGFSWRLFLDSNQCYFS